MQNHSFFQPPPIPQDERLVAIATLECVFVFSAFSAPPQALILLLNAQRSVQFANSLRSCVSVITQPISIPFFEAMQIPDRRNDLGQAFAAILPARLPLLKE